MKKVNTALRRYMWPFRKSSSSKERDLLLRKMEREIKQSKAGKSVLRSSSESPRRNTSELTFSDKVTVQDGSGKQHSYNEPTLQE